MFRRRLFSAFSSRLSRRAQTLQTVSTSTTSTGSLQWRIQDLPKGGPWRALRARAQKRGSGADPPAGSRDRAPGEGSGGRPPEAESFLSIFIQKVAKS